MTTSLPARDAASSTGGVSGLDPAWLQWVLEVARRRLGTDVAWLSEFTGGTQVISAATGDLAAMHVRAGMAVGLEGSFCVRVLGGQLPPLVTGARRNPRTRDLDITAQLGIGSYVGAPVRTADGRPVGMLCCLGRGAGEQLDVEDVRTVEMLADLVSDRLRWNASGGTPEPGLAQRRERVLGVLQSGALEVHFQPVVDMATGRAIGYEGLTRVPGWLDGGPAELVSDAAATGLGVDLEEVAARTALAALDRRPERLPLAVNLSPEALLRPSVVDLLMQHSDQRIGVEVTEHHPIDDYDRLLGVTGLLQSAGVLLSVDDTGAGYASLRHVLRLRPDVIKLDIALVAGVHQDPAKRALIVGLGVFARQTGAALIAEGVEEPEERDVLLDLGVRYGQGYLFARPAPFPG